MGRLSSEERGRMAAAGLEPELRRRAIFIGIAAAAILRMSSVIFIEQYFGPHMLQK